MRLRIKKEEYIPLLILFQNNLILYFSIFLYSVKFTSWLRYSLFPILFVISVLINYKWVLSKVTLKSFLFLVVTLLTIFLHYLIFSDNRKYLLDELGNMLWCVYGGYFFGLAVFDLISNQNERNWNELYLLSVATLAICIAYSIYTLASGRVERYVKDGSDMATSFKVLPALMIICWKGIKTPRLLSIALIIISVIYIISLGTRGAVIWLIIFMTASMIVYNVHQRKISKWLILFGVMLIIAFYFDKILLWLSDLISRLGLSMRIFNKLTEGSFIVSESRDYISTKVIELIKQNPLYGYGILSDRRLIGTYSHNLALEVFLDFGVIAGSIILLWGAYKVIAAFVKAPTLGHRIFELVLFSSSVGILLSSGSYLFSPLFFVLLAYCDSIIIHSKTKKAKQLYASSGGKV